MGERLQVAVRAVMHLPATLEVVVTAPNRAAAVRRAEKLRDDYAPGGIDILLPEDDDLGTRLLLQAELHPLVAQVDPVYREAILPVDEQAALKVMPELLDALVGLLQTVPGDTGQQQREVRPFEKAVHRARAVIKRMIRAPLSQAEMDALEPDR